MARLGLGVAVNAKAAGWAALTVLAVLAAMLVLSSVALYLADRRWVLAVLTAPGIALWPVIARSAFRRYLRRR